MLLDFDNIIQSTFYYGDWASIEPRKDLIEKSLKAEKPSNLSLSLLNEFMELMIFLDQMYSNDPGQKDFFSQFKDPFIYILAKSYDPKWLKFSHQTKEFFSLKVSLPFLFNIELYDIPNVPVLAQSQKFSV
jgi:hypothetical protein